MYAYIHMRRRIHACHMEGECEPECARYAYVRIHSKFSSPPPEERVAIKRVLPLARPDMRARSLYAQLYKHENTLLLHTPLHKDIGLLYTHLYTQV